MKFMNESILFYESIAWIIKFRSGVLSVKEFKDLIAFFYVDGSFYYDAYVRLHFTLSTTMGGGNRFSSIS